MARCLLLCTGCYLMLLTLNLSRSLLCGLVVALVCLNRKTSYGTRWSLGLKRPPQTCAMLLLASLAVFVPSMLILIPYSPYLRTAGLLLINVLAYVLWEWV